MRVSTLPTRLPTQHDPASAGGRTGKRDTRGGGRQTSDVRREHASGAGLDCTQPLFSFLSVRRVAEGAGLVVHIYRLLGSGLVILECTYAPPSVASPLSSRTPPACAPYSIATVLFLVYIVNRMQSI